MKSILTEKNVVVILFVLVLITFSLAQEDSRKMEKIYSGVTAITASPLLAEQPTQKTRAIISPQKSLAAKK